MKGNRSHYFSLPIFLLVSLSAFTFAQNNNPENKGVFSFLIENKQHTIPDNKAVIRMVTGGKKQLSLSNTLFTKFCIINPTVKEITLAQGNTSEAIIYYTDPGNLNLYKPQSGFIRILKIDNDKKVVSGEFEMILSSDASGTKPIKIKNGKFTDIPLIYR